MKSILSCDDWSREDIYELFRKTDNNNKLENTNKILINVFFESSTRTQMSFESAMLRSGGKVINFQKNMSSLNKGESYEDTIKTLSMYGDIMVIRHPEVGKVSLANSIVDIPIINGGDGNGEHPTQALIDLYTIYKKFNYNFIFKCILFVGDIKNSRTIHSLIKLINLYPNMKIYILPYEGLEPDNNFLENIAEIHNQNKDEIQININKIDYKMFDIIYVTRLQKERLLEKNNVVNNNQFILDNSIVSKLKEECIIMHPLPRNSEINPEIDDDERCVYFDQVKFGIEIRKVLIDLLLKI